MAADGKGKELKGRVKEAAGALTGDEETAKEGRKDQRSGKLEQAKEKIGDAAEDVKEGLTP
jgi:uncharacterized protein YjbJ (UPF0337 family)